MTIDLGSHPSYLTLPLSTLETPQNTDQFSDTIRCINQIKEALWGTVPLIDPEFVTFHSHSHIPFRLPSPNPDILAKTGDLV